MVLYIVITAKPFRISKIIMRLYHGKYISTTNMFVCLIIIFNI